MFKKARLLLYLGLIAALPACSSNVSIDDEVVRGPIAEKLDTYLSRITPFGFSGVLLVARNGEIILNKGYGLADRAGNVPNTSRTVHSTGSITKQFTAAAIMKLEMARKLATEDRLTRFFDNVPVDKQAITLHHLLTHTSGLIDYTGSEEGGWDIEKVGREEVIKRMFDADLQFPPGTEFSYSNAGYSLLAAVIEKVSGQDYETYLLENLFKPAGMRFTGYRIPDWEKRPLAHLYTGGDDNGTFLERDYPYWNLLGNGGILSMTGDMYRWHLALSGDKILSEAAKKKLYKPFLNEYAYGWDYLETDLGVVIQHDGGGGLGNSSEFRRYIDSNVVTMLFCNQHFQGQALFQVVRDKIESIVFGGDVPVPPEIEDAPVPARTFTGKYYINEESYISVTPGDGNLNLVPVGQDALDAVLAGENQKTEKYNKLSREVMTSVVEGDFEPLESKLRYRTRRIEPVKNLIVSRMNWFQEDYGEIVEVGRCLSFASDYEDSGVDTYVELKAENQQLCFLLIWKDSQNIGVAPAPGIPEKEIPIRPVNDLEFVGYDIPTASTIEMTFKTDESDRVIAILLTGKAEAALFSKRI